MSETISSSRKNRPWRIAGIILGGIFGLLILLMVLLALDANMFRVPLAKAISAATHRTITNGGLRINVFSAPPHITVEKLVIGNPTGFQNQMGSVEKIDLTFAWLPLFTGHLVLPQLNIAQPIFVLTRTADKKANWEFGDDSKPSSGSSKLPVIQNLSLNGGNITLDDAVQKMHFQGNFQTSNSSGDAGTAPFQLIGEGTQNQKPFKINFSGASLFDLKPEQPYNFDTVINLGKTEIHATGSIPKPFDLTNFQSQLDLKGDDLADLYYLTGLAFPNTPPYHIKGELTGADHSFHFANFGGNLGSSDLFGDIQVLTNNKKPKIIADLKSKLLDFKDLGALFGARVPGSAGAGTKVAVTSSASDRLLPDAPLQVERVRAMDAEVHYRAAAVNAPGLPLKQVSLDFYLEDSIMNFKPFSFTLPQGKLEGTAQVDARPDVPVVDMDVRLSNAHLEDFMKTKSGPPAIAGAILARVKLHGVGDSVHRAASSANGEITLVVPHGEIRRAFAELLGIDVVEGLGMLLSDDHEKTELRCGIADFNVKQGVLRPQVMVFDTGVVLTHGSGSVDLKSEALDLELQGKPKEARLLRIMAPITISGTLAHPSVGIDPKKSGAQAGVATALAFLAPIAAVIPFINLDLAKDANCQGLLSQAPIHK